MMMILMMMISIMMMMMMMIMMMIMMMMMIPSIQAYDVQLRQQQDHREAELGMPLINGLVG